MHSRLVTVARDDPERAVLGFELVLAAATLLGVALTLVSPLVESRSLVDVGLPIAMVSISVLTVTSLLAGSRRIVRLVTGRGGLSIESFWRMLEVMFAFFVAGIVALAIHLGQYAQDVPNPRGGGGVTVGLFLAFVLAGVGLAVIVCLRGMWRVVDAELQSALSGV
ncbi:MULTISPECIES: hypothetical protein [Haloferax]|uniref:Uncharacterized protein n=1 Tax=Haloferax marinum TaxID=2666143 RepID=A0A6A8G4A7_9EURY|nr:MULTISPECIES: hypothetical protein [Haloferax]KAB1196535.1 hypothetical protein Hfx1150_02990 [Haloferax sp. CBA1150]MRW95537.1 hypothetical protein [Haloferax marinum]